MTGSTGISVLMYQQRDDFFFGNIKHLPSARLRANNIHISTSFHFHLG